MEIHLDKRAVKHIRLSAADAIEEGDTEALREEIFEAFPEEMIESLEQVLGDGDFMAFISEILDEWGGDDVDELFELLETQLGDQGVDLKYHTADDDEEEEAEEEDDDEEEDEEEEDDDESEDAEDYDGYDEPGVDEDY
jgi:hypothetical protein